MGDVKKKRITKKEVTEAENRFYRERQRWGENNLATARAEIHWHDLRDQYAQQASQSAAADKPPVIDEHASHPHSVSAPGSGSQPAD